MEFAAIYIYRMTHIENIPHILTHGITHKKSNNRNPNYKDIGDREIIAVRTYKNVAVSNGDVLGNSELINLGDFIPFYFGVRMPMLYVTMHGGNFVEKVTRQENIVYLVCNVKQLHNSGLFTCYFSDGSAVQRWSKFYGSDKILDLPELINWDAVKAKDWGGEENSELKWKKQAEFLIREEIPLDFVFGYVCYNEIAKQRLIEMGVDPQKIKVHPNSYF